MNKPSDYKHIAAWGRMMSSYGSYVKKQQALAAKEGAPINAIFRNDKEGWQTYDDCVLACQRRIDFILEEMK